MGGGKSTKEKQLSHNEDDKNDPEMTLADKKIILREKLGKKERKSTQRQARDEKNEHYN